MKGDKNKDEIQFDISEDIAEGIYSNVSTVVHSSCEFVLDFARVVPDIETVKVKARIVMTPEKAKKLLYALEENIAIYEQSFGEINIDPYGYMSLLTSQKGEA